LIGIYIYTHTYTPIYINIYIYIYIAEHYVCKHSDTIIFTYIRTLFVQCVYCSVYCNVSDSMTKHNIKNSFRGVARGRKWGGACFLRAAIFVRTLFLRTVILGTPLPPNSRTHYPFLCMEHITGVCMHAYHSYFYIQADTVIASSNSRRPTSAPARDRHGT